MDYDADDPASLFTPVRNSISSRNSEANTAPPSTSPSPDAPARSNRVKDTRGFVVELPKLGKKNLDKYQPIIVSDNDTDPDPGDATRIEEIEGEHKSGNKLFLFARHGDGILRRVCSSCLILRLLFSLYSRRKTGSSETYILIYMMNTVRFLLSSYRFGQF